MSQSTERAATGHVQSNNRRSVGWLVGCLSSRCRLIQVGLRFRVDLGGSRSYWNRLLFIDVCGFILEFFSKRFFKTTFFEFVLVLAKVMSRCWSLMERQTGGWTDKHTDGEMDKQTYEWIGEQTDRGMDRQIGKHTYT